MMKKMTILFLCAIASTMVMPLFAASETVDGVAWYYDDVSINTATGRISGVKIISGTDIYRGDLRIPSTLGNRPVLAIGDDAFNKCDGLTSIVIPEGVVQIGYTAFIRCASLTELVFPDSVTTVGSYVCQECENLKRICWTKGSTKVPFGAFRWCPRLESIVIPEGIVAFDEEAFCGDSGIKRISLPSSLSVIGPDALLGVGSVVEEISVGAGSESLKVVNGCLVSMSGSTLFVAPGGTDHIVIPDGVKAIPNQCLKGSNFRSIVIPESVISIGSEAFSNCGSIQSVAIPAGVKSVGSSTFSNCVSLKDICFLGDVPDKMSSAKKPSSTLVRFTRAYGAAWRRYLQDVNGFGGFVREDLVAVEVISSRIRESDPAILDVVYRVTSAQPNVKVRVLAFEDGERSFAKVVRPETFVADTNGVATAGNVGDMIAPNVPHTLSWKVSNDWSNRLARVKFEVLATEGDLVPLEVRTIPASTAYGKMDVTWNVIREDQWFDALLWLYADKHAKLTVQDGVCFYGDCVVAKNATAYYGKTSKEYYSRSYDSSTRQYQTVYYKNLPDVVLEVMGYEILTGDVLNYVNEETRLGLQPSKARQYGYRIVTAD